MDAVLKRQSASSHDDGIDRRWALGNGHFLPIPSSVISTLGGWQLGWWQGTLATWVGMNVGAIFGFALARKWGRTFARWFCGDESLDQMQRINERYGPIVLAITRAMPVFAEASVLIAGIHRLPWSRFLPAIVLSNLGVALAYSAFGDYAQKHQWLPLALGVSVAIPVIIAGIAQSFVPHLSLDRDQTDVDVSEDE